MAAVLELSFVNPLFSSKSFPSHPPPCNPKILTFSVKSKFLTLRCPSDISRPCCAGNVYHSSSLSGPKDPDPDTKPDPESTRDRRRAVRLAWEKLVRWSRSWRSKVKTDVLERTNKVFLCFLLLLYLICLSFFWATGYVIVVIFPGFVKF